MRLLRDLRESTRLLFLYEVTTNRHTRLRTIAEALGMTIQGASDYAHDLQRIGLLAAADGEYRATKKGVAHLQDGFLELRAFVDRAGRAMALVETTAAIAGGPVRRGERVGLFMEDGYLVAHAGRASPSSGLAAHDASEGDDVAVRGLEGIVGLHPGRVIVARIPSVSDGGARAIRPGSVKKVLARARGFAVAAHDVTGAVAARRLGLRPRIEFGLPAGVIEAAERGVDILLLVPEDRAAEAVQAIEAANARLEDKIPYESVALG
jgi:putative transcriptional regulator